MSETVRIGVIGTSLFADRMHLANLKSHPQVDLVAICGRTVERAEEMAQKYEIPHILQWSINSCTGARDDVSCLV